MKKLLITAADWYVNACTPAIKKALVEYSEAAGLEWGDLSRADDQLYIHYSDFGTQLRTKSTPWTLATTSPSEISIPRFLKLCDEYVESRKPQPVRESVNLSGRDLEAEINAERTEVELYIGSKHIIGLTVPEVYRLTAFVRENCPE